MLYFTVAAWFSVIHLEAADAKANSGADPGPASAIHKLRVEDDAVSQELQAKGARLVADYGNYQLLEMFRRLCTDKALQV
jgi:muconolactone delta-isomerase